MKEWSQKQQLVLVTVLVTGAVAAYLAFGKKPGAPMADADTAPASEAVGLRTHRQPAASQCESEEACSVERLKPAAERSCRSAIRDRAKYELQWDSSGRPLFVRAGWSDDTHTAITFGGDAVSFQNGFGAYEHMAYLCTVDGVSGAITDLQIAPGRMPVAGSRPAEM